MSDRYFEFSGKTGFGREKNLGRFVACLPYTVSLFPNRKVVRDRNGKDRAVLTSDFRRTPNYVRKEGLRVVFDGSSYKGVMPQISFLDEKMLKEAFRKFDENIRFKVRDCRPCEMERLEFEM